MKRRSDVYQERLFYFNMRKFLYIAVLFVISNNIYAQDSLSRTEKLFINFSMGLPILGNENLTLNSYELKTTNPFLETTNPFFAKISFSYIFENHFGLYGAIKRIAYRYSFSENLLLVNNPGFSVLKTDNYLEYLGGIYSFGVTYKINFKRFFIFPNIGIGIRDFINKYGGAVLKENNSNTIRSILNLSSIKENKATLSMGLDLCYCITNKLSITIVIDYDRFNPNLHSLLVIKEYNKDSRLEKDFNLKQNKILLGFGFLIKM